MTKKEDYFTTICKISRLFGTTKKTKPLLDLVVESAIDTMAGKAACLFLCDENPGHFTIAAQKGLSDNYLHAGSTKVKKVLKLLMSKGYFQIKDACSDPRVDNHDIKKAEGIASLLVVPVKVKNVVIGVLTLYTREIRVFDSDEILFLSALAEQGGIAIEKSRLLDQILRYVRLYHDLTVNINSSLDLKDILDKMACDIAEALDVKATSVKLLDSRGKDLKVVAHFGLSDDYVKTEHSMNDKGIIEALNGQPVVISSVSTEKGVENRNIKEKEGICSILTVPIKAREEFIGVLRLYSDIPREFSTMEVMLVTALANQGGLAIQNATLYSMLQEDMTDLKNDMWSHKSWF